MKHFSHLNTATQIVQQYEGKEPLHHYLKNIFSQHKKFGSKDRKSISHLCYLFYRVARGFPDAFANLDQDIIQQKILTGLFLCSYEPNELLAAIKPTWNENIMLGFFEKEVIIQNEIGGKAFDVKDIFPATHELSHGINEEPFILSHLEQPDLFIRVRPGHLDAVIERLKNLEVMYEFIPESAVRLPNGFKIQDHFEFDRQVVVQDLSSQKVGQFIQLVTEEKSNLNGNQVKNDNRPIVVWDCCAASGGKSIMAKDILRSIDLTVSDVRKSILINLKRRFETAKIKSYKSFIADLSSDNYKPGNTTYDLIIADLPCTGSGTWSRTPEQMYFFQPETIANYNRLQKKILDNTIPHLKESGKLLYVTCSVFKKENEDVIEYVRDKFQLKLERMEVLTGYDKKADTLFAALLSRLH